jgi:hypothetical protein
MKNGASSFLKNINLFLDFLFNLHQLEVWAEDLHHPLSKQPKQSQSWSIYHFLLQKPPSLKQ